MLQIKDLCKSYGHFKAVDHLNLEIKKGSAFGFVGPNGAGKTTTMRIVSGLLSPTSGEVYVDGIDAIRDTEQLKRKIGYMPDFFGVYDNLKAIEYMEFYASMYGLVGKEATKTCRELMALVNLEEKEDFYVDSLSRGMKQRLCLARSLVHNPSLLILDEPASGLDPRARFEMKEIIKNLADMGKTIMISSHILPELAQMCDCLGIMKQGSLFLEGTVEEILQKSQQNSSIKIQIFKEQEKAVEIVKANPHVEKLSIQEKILAVHFNGTEQDEYELLKELIDYGVGVHGFVKEAGDLEELFMELTDDDKEVE